MPYPAKVKGVLSKDVLFRLYVDERLSFAKIAEMYDCGSEAVRLLAKQYGIPARTASENASTRSHKRVNERFFSEWSVESAYALGVIVTDGSIDPRTGNLRISMTDFDVVEKIASAMSLSNGLRYTQRGDSKPQLLLSVCRKEISRDLKRLGVIFGGEKTTTQKWIDVPKELRSHFIRGIFDGDGCVLIRKNGKKEVIFVSASLALMEGLSSALYDDLGINRKPIKYKEETETTSAMYRVALYAQKDIELFRDYIYRDCGEMFMRRKYDKLFE